MPVRRRIDSPRFADRFQLHVHRFAKGTYPEACGITEALPVNRFFIPLSNPSGAECFLEDGRNHFVLTPGNAYFIPLNYPAKIRLDDYLTFVSIQFTLELYEGIDVFSAFGNICEIPGVRWAEQGKRAYEEKNKHFSSAILHSLIFEFSTAVMERMTELEWGPVASFSDFQMELDFIHSNRKRLAQISVSDLAGVRNFSREYFTRTFSRITGISPKKFLTDILLNQSRRLLMRENISIKEVSVELGFSSEFYFSKFCRKHTGLSPRLYRTKFRN